MMGNHRWLILAAALLVCGTPARGREPVKVTPRLVGIAPIKYKVTDREGFTLKVAFDAKDGRIPNSVTFTVHTALVGWELLHGENSFTCENDPRVDYHCIRPTAAVETLYFGRYDFVLTDEDKRFYNPQPLLFHELSRNWKNYIHIQVQHASVWSEAEMAEEGFREALSEHGWKHNTHFQSNTENGRMFVGYQPDKPLVVVYWADLSEEEVARGRELVTRLAGEHKIHVVVRKGNRLWSGGTEAKPVEPVEPVKSVDPPRRRAG